MDLKEFECERCGIFIYMFRKIRVDGKVKLVCNECVCNLRNKNLLEEENE
tara:strand:+ start:3088 stop:3237 length:150 start_codon:yes stop_codon:yes gene_type:complete